MKVIHLSHSDANGGAARAAYRVHHALRASGVDSQMWVNEAATGDWTVEGPSSRRHKASVAIRPQLARPLVRALKTDNPIIHSPAVVPSSWLRRINASDADVVHLHWVQGEMLSIADIGRIEKPIVWTLHDMWAFCGAEHYTEEFRWREGYRRDNRPSYESGFDLNHWSWQRKRKHWRQPMHIVTPSRWLGDCVRGSELMRDWPLRLISYPIDTEWWRPIDQSVARRLLGLAQDVPLILFGAVGGERDPRKGYDLLCQALNYLRNDPQTNGLHLVIFGQAAPKSPPDLGYPLHYAGHLDDDIRLKLLYNAADVFALPSRQDNQPLTCMESLSCGTPVVAFDTSGPPSMIEHQKSGYLAKSFEVEEFAKGIQWALQHRGSGNIQRAARLFAEEHFDPTRIAEQYRSVYDGL
jgi:glycosyltransferase involved in cell wall biosynthesis